MMTPNNKKTPALGRGLSALLTDNSSGTGGTILVEISQIEANPFNPRSHFEQMALEELANSIKELGIIQPLTLRLVSPNKYQLISGERRLRASQMAGLKEVPAYVRLANDQSMLEMALVENIQRENLNAIEIGLSYQRLIEECKYTQAELGTKISKSRSDIANHLRLLKLPAEIQASVRDGKISMGHARALLSLESSIEQLKAFKAITDNNLSVREVENWQKTTVKSQRPKSKITQLNSLEKQIKDSLGIKVKVTQDLKGKGKITLNYQNETELNRLLEKLSKK